MTSAPEDPTTTTERSTVGSRRRSAWLRALAIDLRPLGAPAFRRLWIGQVVSFIGFQLTAVAMSVQVYALTHSSFWVGLLGPANLLPLIVFGLWGGAVADAMDRRLLLIFASLISWISTFGLLLQAVLRVNSVGLIIVLVVVQSIGFAMTSPARGAVIPRLLPASLVAAGNTLVFTGAHLAMFAGPLLGAAVIDGDGYAIAYGIDALMFTAGLYAAVRLPRLPPLSDEIGRPGLRSVVEGLGFLMTRPVLLMSFVVDVIAMGVAMPRALFPELAQTRFGGSFAVGWLFAAMSIGALAGGLASGWIGRVRRQGAALILAVLIWGAAVAASGLTGSLWVAVLLLALGGAADLVSVIFRQTILQTYAPDEMRGRLQGVFTVVVAGSPRLGDMRAGTAAALAGATASWVGGGVACVLLVAVVALLVPSLAKYETG